MRRRVVLGDLDLPTAGGEQRCERDGDDERTAHGRPYCSSREDHTAGRRINFAPATAGDDLP